MIVASEAEREAAPRIAVVVPSYRAARHLPGAIASIRAQRLAPVEVIVVDDGSPDGDGDVAELLGATVVRQRNAGVAAARNVGVARATAPWVAFLDADDRWEPGHLAGLVEGLGLAPTARLAASDYVSVRENGAESASLWSRSAVYLHTPKRRLASDVALIRGARLVDALPALQFLAPSTVLVARDLALAHPFAPGLPENAFSFVAEDLEWYLRIVAVTDLVAVERPTMRYGVGAPSLSSVGGRAHLGVVALHEVVAAAPGDYADGALSALRRVRRARAVTAVRSYLRALDGVRALAALRWLADLEPPVTLPLHHAVAHAIANPFGSHSAGMVKALVKRARPS